MIVVSNSGPLIALSKLGLLSLLQKIFGKIILPEEVWKEVVEKGKGKAGSDIIAKAEWIEVRKIEELSIEVLCKEIERGEAEAIVLAKRINADLLLIDEKIPREIAKSIGLNVVGVLGLIYEAISRGIVKRDFVKITEDMRRHGIWISDEVSEEVKRKFGC